MSKIRYTLAVMVDNKAGVLSQVSRLFSRKGYNIESLAVGVTDNPDVSRMTIEILAEDDKEVAVLSNQVRKMFPVHSVKILKTDQSIRRELVLIKVHAETADQRNEIIQISNIFRASVIDVAPASLTVAVIGEEDKTSAILALFEKNGIVELVRTGIVSLERGAFTLNEETKVRGEFNYGKNVR